MFGRRERRLKRVLVVEDEPLVAFDNEHVLSEEGFEVVATVDRLDDALRAIETSALDIVISDISLSGDGSGLDVARAAAGRGVRTLFAAGQCPAGIEEHAVGCLAKPYSQRDLIAALDAIEAVAAGRKPKRVPRGLKLF